MVLCLMQGDTVSEMISLQIVYIIADIVNQTFFHFLLLQLLSSQYMCVTDFLNDTTEDRFSQGEQKYFVK